MKLIKLQRVGILVELVIFLVILVAWGIDAKTENVTLDILSLPQGLLKGLMQTSRDKRVYYSFMSIPYAKPPRMKFESAEPGGKWDGMLDATKPAPPCAQLGRRSGSTEVVGQEDCLYLAVHTPKEALSRRDSRRRRQDQSNMDLLYPVILFIHDEMFTWGSGDDFGGKYFLDENVILVTFNYRLGALGFLSTGDGEILGNVGLKDQSLALKWVQSNIEYFGGDPRRVTLFGAGAGAVSAQLHMMSKSSYGLFSHVIAASGSALVPWAISKNPAETARKFGTRVGCNSTNSRDLSLCLKAKDFKEIIRAQATFLDWGNDPLAPFLPTIEMPTVQMLGLRGPLMNRAYSHLNTGKHRESIFLHADPLKLISEGQFQRVPQLTGFLRNEILFTQHSEGILNNRKFVTEMNEEWHRVAPIALLYETETSRLIQHDKDAIADKIKSFYFGNKQIGSETRENVTNMYSDRYITHGVEMAAFHFAQFSAVYPFELSFEPSRSFANRGNVKEVVAHGLQYFFDMKNVPISTNSPEEMFSKKVVKLWTHFATSLYGKPTSTMMASTEWLPRSTNTQAPSYGQYYDLNGGEFKSMSSDAVLSNRMRFWTHLFDRQLNYQQNMNVMNPNRNQFNYPNYPIVNPNQDNRLGFVQQPLPYLVPQYPNFNQPQFHYYW